MNTPKKGGAFTSISYDKDTENKKIGGIRRVITYSLILLAILFPTMLAVINVIYTNGELSGKRSSTIVELYDINDNLLYSENSDYKYERDDSLVAIFNAIYDNLEKCPPISDSIHTAEPLKVHIISGSSPIELICYFSFTESGSYCVDAGGQYYTIPNVYSDYFLNSYFAETLYYEATAPTLSTVDGDTIIPKSTIWKYKTIDGSTKTALRTTTTDEVNIYYTTGSIALEFDDQPDYCLVRIFENSKVIFEGAPEELSYITLDSSTLLHMTVRAVWDNVNGRRSYGEISYAFDILIHNRASFELSGSSLSRGDMLVLVADNVTDVSRLMFSSPDTAMQPIFRLINGAAYALIPYPKDCADSDFEFTVSYGVSGRTFTVALDTDSTPSTNLSDMALGVFDIDASELKNVIHSQCFLSDLSIPPEAQGFAKVTSFGEHVKFGNYPLISILTEYSCESYGTPVRACFGGKVTLVGNSNVIGKYAVIDSGMGIKLWYCELGALDVKVGDYVAVGDIVGKTSQLSTGRGEGFALMITCYDSLISAEKMLRQDS